MSSFQSPSALGESLPKSHPLMTNGMNSLNMVCTVFPFIGVYQPGRGLEEDPTTSAAATATAAEVAVPTLGTAFIDTVGYIAHGGWAAQAIFGWA